MPIYRNSLTKMSCKSTRTHIKADDRQSTRERTLSGPWAPLVSLSFHLRSAFTPRFTFRRLLSRCDMTASLLAFGSYPWICENVARAACTLWSRGSSLGAALVSALCICCFLAHRLLYGTLWFVVSLLFYIAIPIPEVIQCYHLFLHFPNVHELISWPPTVLVFVLCLFVVCVFFCVFVCFVCFWVFGVCFFVLHGDSSMDYVSIQFSSLLYHIVIMTDVATALIRWICTMQLSFRLDKRPGESHLALDGKKRCARWCHWTVRYVWCPFLGLERYMEFGLPKAVLPSFSPSVIPPFELGRVRSFLEDRDWKHQWSLDRSRRSRDAGLASTPQPDIYRHDWRQSRGWQHDASQRRGFTEEEESDCTEWLLEYDFEA